MGQTVTDKDVQLCRALPCRAAPDRAGQGRAGPGSVGGAGQDSAPHGSSESHEMLKRNVKYHSIADDVPIPKM